MAKKTGLQKQAAKDAREYAAAYMSYGEGAGTRRKLIEGTVDYKMHHIPGYSEAFDKAFRAENMEAHAASAKREHRRKSVNKAVVRNTKAITTGRYESVNTSILVVGAAAVLLHKTGYDKKLIEGVKSKYKALRRRFRKHPNKDNVYRITDV